MIERLRGSWVLFVLALPACILPLALPAFPSQDGPSHIGTAAILGGLLSGQQDFGQAFETTAVTTNLLVHYALIPLVAVMDGRTVEKLLVSMLIAGGAWGVWRCASSLRPANRWLCSFGAVAGYTTTLYAGNYNFVASIVLMLFIVGYVLRQNGRFSATSGGLLALLVVLCALAHPIGTAFAVAGVGVLVVWLDWCRDSSRGWREFAARLPRTVFVPFVAMLPAMAILAFYASRNVDSAAEFGPGIFYGPGVLHRLKSTIGLRQLYTVENWQIFACFAGALCLIAATVSALGRRIAEIRTGSGPVASDGLMLVAAVSLAVYLAVPDRGGGAGYIVMRLDLIPWLFVLAWLVVRPFGLVERIATYLLVGPVSAALLAANAIAMMAPAAETAKLAALEARIPAGATVLPIVTRQKPLYEFPGQGMLQNNPYQHVHHHAAANRNAVMLNNWNAHYPGMPIRFRDSADPYRHFDPVAPTAAGIGAYELAVGRPISAILVIGMEPREVARMEPALRLKLNDAFCVVARVGNFGLLLSRPDPNSPCVSPQL